MRASLAAIAALFLAAPGAFAGSCTLTQLTSIPATITAGNQLLVPVEINGVSLPMLFDTGTRRVALSRAAGARLDLPLFNKREAHLLGGDWLNEHSKISSIHMGAMSAAAYPALVYGTGSDGSDGRVAGLIGTEAGSIYGTERFIDIELDPAAGLIKIFEPAHCPGQVVYWAPEFNNLKMLIEPDTLRATVDVELDGKPLRAMIDTGASWTTMPSERASFRFDLGSSSPGVTPADGLTIDAQLMPASAYSFHTLKIGNITVSNPKILLADFYTDPRRATGSHFARGPLLLPDLIIGMNILKSLHLYLAYDEGTLYYTPAQPQQARG